MTPFWTLDRLGRALRGVATLPSPSGSAPLGGVATDTRTIEPGSVFVALRGERFDAHDFLAQAVEKGAAAVVVSDPTRAAALSVPVYVVTDTTAALGALGAFRRRVWGGTVVAVAGSNGKTTTKALVRAALGGTFEVHATQGNLNNQIGVPLTLLAIPEGADVAVVEVGTSEPGEVELLRRLVAPDIAVVTSVGEEHLEGLGSLAGVLREETSIFRDTPLAIAPASQPEVGAAARVLAQRALEAGLDAGEFRPDRWEVGGDGRGWAEFGAVRLDLAIPGAHNLRNAMLALAVARACGVPLAVAAQGISSVAPLDMRGAWLAMGALTVINDAYNANPGSMREAIALLDALETPRPRVLVLGTMRELGPSAAELHDEVARRAVASRAAIVAGLGDFAAPLERLSAGDGRVVVADDVDELWASLSSALPRDAIVLLKASRGVRLERLLPHLQGWASA